MGVRISASSRPLHSDSAALYPLSTAHDKMKHPNQRPFQQGGLVRILLSIALTSVLSGCAALHHAQVGDIDARDRKAASKIDVKLSETGINLREANEIVRRLGNARWAKQSDDATAIMGLFQLGPRTGNPVYSPEYARPIFELLYGKCPSGKVSNLMIVRETRKYPVVSGEIVKVSGDCWR